MFLLEILNHDFSSILNRFVTIFLLFALSLAIRFSMQLMGQRWVMTWSHTCTLIVLPIGTYVITSVIAGDIALSLGLVGALSIVRFRNPVRSPLELSMYFVAITLGIAASINNLWPIFLAASLMLVGLATFIISLIARYVYNSEFLISSFSEGSHLCVLELTSTEELQELNVSTLLTSKSSDGNVISYSLTSPQFEPLVRLQETLAGDKRVISFQLNK